MLDQILWILFGVLSLIWLFFEFFKSWCFFIRYNVKYDLGIRPWGLRFHGIFNDESWSKTLEQIYYKYPNEKFVGLTDIGGKVQWLIRDPGLVRQIAVRDFSHFVNRIDDIHSGTDPIVANGLSNLKANDWRQMRTILTPLLSGQKLKQIVIPSLDDNKIELIQFLKNEMKQRGENVLSVNMMDLVTRSGVDGFCLTAFSLKTNSLNKDSENYGFFDVADSYSKHIDSLGYGVYRLIVKFPRIMKYLFGKTITKHQDDKFFTQSCQNIADQRIEKKFSRSDYLDLLQTLRDRNQIKKFEYKDAHMISQIFELFQGVITENNVLITFIANRLSENHEIQQRLYDEFTKVKSSLNGKVLTYETLNQMKYMNLVIDEALRMCPIAPELKRRATKPYFFETTDGGKVSVKPGDAIWIPAFILQNDPQYYPNPDIFDPDRFIDRSNHTPGTYAPYGMGPRDCVGCQYTTVEVKIIFYYLLLDFVIDQDDKFNITLQTRSN